MKNFIAMTATAAALTLTAPTFAQSTPAEVDELLSLSNSSAAERIVGDTSTGNPALAEMKFALGEMSAAERRTFFESDEETRAELVAAKRLLKDGDSPAESAAIGSTDVTN